MAKGGEWPAHKLHDEVKRKWAQCVGVQRCPLGLIAYFLLFFFFCSLVSLDHLWLLFRVKQAVPTNFRLFLQPGKGNEVKQMRMRMRIANAGQI